MMTPEQINKFQEMISRQRAEAAARQGSLECFLAHATICGALLSQQQAAVLLSEFGPDLYKP